MIFRRDAFDDEATSDAGLAEQHRIVLARRARTRIVPVSSVVARERVQVGLARQLRQIACVSSDSFGCLLLLKPVRDCCAKNRCPARSHRQWCDTE